MNRKITLFLSAAAAVVLGAACVVLLFLSNAKRQRDHAVAVEVAAAEAAARAATAERLNEAERDRSRAEKQNRELAELAQNLRQSEAKQASNVAALVKQMKSSTNSAGDGASGALGGGQGMGEMFQKMMNDPAMKEMVRSQQKSMMKTMYGSLFKELNLPAEQQKKLTELLLDAQMSGVESTGDLFKGEDAARTNAVNTLAEKQKATQAQIKALLGDEKYTQYEDYQKTLAERMVLNQFQQESAGTQTELRDDQMQRLVDLIKEERAKIPPVFDEDPGKTAENLQKVLNTELFDKQMQWQEDLNKRVLARAGGVLTPEQLKEYGEFQESQLNMQKLGMKMARELFKGKDAP
ncbi:MAG TPA: hypothetical protein VFT34_00455 [Verrucomicrobiae bacterium]|nr:hypothetical protein [Verrucomicrobiae bacterium]